MATWTQLDTAIGRLKIQLVLTEQDPERATHWYGRAVREISWLTDDLQRANQQARAQGEVDAIAVEIPVLGEHSAAVIEGGPPRAGLRPYQPTGRPTGHGEPAYETTDPEQSSTLPPTTDTTGGVR